MMVKAIVENHEADLVLQAICSPDDGIHFFFFQAEDGIRDDLVTGVQTCALPIYKGVTRGPVAGNWTAGHSFISHQGGQTPEVPDPNDNWKLRLVAVHDQPILGSLGRPSAVLSLAPAESIVANTAAGPGRPLGELLTLPPTIATAPPLSVKQPLFATARPVNPDLTAR